MLIHADPKVKGLIFDCDGTLVDSMPLQWKRGNIQWKNSTQFLIMIFSFSKRNG